MRRLTKAEARAIVAPLYEALNEPAKKDVPALLAQATHPDYRSCSTLIDCLDRDALASVFSALGKDRSGPELGDRGRVGRGGPDHGAR